MTAYLRHPEPLVGGQDMPTPRWMLERRYAVAVGDGEHLDIRALQGQIRDQPARPIYGLVGVGSDHDEITAEVGRQRRNPTQLLSP
jgi:hypothetical protein